MTDLRRDAEVYFIKNFMDCNKLFALVQLLLKTTVAGRYCVCYQVNLLDNTDLLKSDSRQRLYFKLDRGLFGKAVLVRPFWRGCFGASLFKTSKKF